MHTFRCTQHEAMFRILRWVGLCAIVASSTAFAQGGGIAPQYRVGMTQLEYEDTSPTPRTLALTLFYPATVPEGARELHMPFFTNLHLYPNAPIVQDGIRRPLIVFSHGHGSNGLYYAWFAEYLAARGYVVATLYHYRANTYDATVLYTRSMLWQRPLDISKDITFLLRDSAWGPHLDPRKIGVAGHSQGGFTALWIGGAKVNEARFRAYLQRWKNDPLIPASLRRELPLDPTPALDVHDARIKAVFAMAPGDLPGFGMDEAGLRQLSVPTYVIVGARDTQAPPAENAEFAARYALHAQLDVMAGAVDHEIFVNECDQDGRDTWPEACVDAAGVDRAQWHEHIGSAAVRFFDTTLDVMRSTP